MRLNHCLDIAYSFSHLPVSPKLLPQYCLFFISVGRLNGSQGQEM